MKVKLMRRMNYFLTQNMKPGYKIFKYRPANFLTRAVWFLIDLDLDKTDPN